MSEKTWFPGGWIADVSQRAILHIKAGYREPGVTIPTEDVDISIPDTDIVGLVSILEARGYIKPRLDERLRVEDLKITHRLLDIIEKQVLWEPHP